MATTRVERLLNRAVELQETLFQEASGGNVSESEFVRRAHDIVSLYDQALSIDPNNVTALVLYGKLLRRLGSTEDAQVMFAHANSLDPNIAVVKQQIGNYLAEHGDYAHALAFYMAAIQLEPDTAAYHYGLGELIHTFKGEFIKDGALTDESADKEMLSAFANAARLAPDNKDFAFRYGEAFYDLADPDWTGAMKVWDSLAARDDLGAVERDAVRLHRARVFLEMGEPDQARELLATPVVAPLEASRGRLALRLKKGDYGPKEGGTDIPATVAGEPIPGSQEDGSEPAPASTEEAPLPGLEPRTFTPIAPPVGFREPEATDESRAQRPVPPKIGDPVEE